MRQLRNQSIWWTSLLALLVGLALMCASPSVSMATSQSIADSDPGDFPAGGGGIPVPGNGVGDPDEPTTSAKGVPVRDGGRLGASPAGVGDARGIESVWMWRLQTVLQIMLRYRPLP